eukprot:CAMPEP_0195098008 /NCGR_PEP_ID=MMETSP0448-20130528/55726_1 /TAXON_ID=66468 /ORGANISM="Heterocapsa triquestra, Strain CCMP 448" /LENGTH=41 /DNA_ID= /DNA_START= /DNA_END= /DNA_ORIENTATION=
MAWRSFDREQLPPPSLLYTACLHPSFSRHSALHVSNERGFA